MKIEKVNLPEHKHCDMCEEPQTEYYVCDKCNHTECKKCYDEWIEGQHPCRWLQYKNECYDRPPLKDEHQNS